MSKEFSVAVCEKIGSYVYVLRDPRDHAIFYVGKGKGNRMFQHAKGALENPTESEKVNLIKEILQSGSEVEYWVLRHNLTEAEAYGIEAACIDLLSIGSGKNKLTTKQRGHYSGVQGLMTADEVVQFYDAEAITLDEPTIIITINGLFPTVATPEDLYVATRASWRVSVQRARKAKYAIAAYRGIVREVYKIDSWAPNGDRWEFHGQIAEQEVREKYLNKSLKSYISKGAQNPIRYNF